jgi:hypothetical protein
MSKKLVTVHIRNPKKPVTENSSLCGRSSKNLALTLEAASHHPVDEKEKGMICMACRRMWMRLEVR